MSILYVNITSRRTLSVSSSQPFRRRRSLLASSASWFSLFAYKNMPRRTRIDGSSVVNVSYEEEHSHEANLQVSSVTVGESTYL